MRKSTAPTPTTVIKRLVGIDPVVSRDFLLEESYVPGQGFWSQYVGLGAVSCATTAICAYALSEMGSLTPQQKREFQRLLLAFRLADPAGAFPRTTGGTASTWTTGQAVLALLSLGAPWSQIRPSIEWLIAVQAPNGGWNFPGSDAGQERLIYSFYPALVLARCSRRIGPAAAYALSRLRSFIASADDRQDPFWTPLRLHLELLTRGSRSRKRIDHGMFSDYWQLFEDGWPTRHVTENWFTLRFNMALMCGSNYLHLRRIVQPDDAMALLHVRYLADERVGSGWNDEHEQNPKTWATALGALTLNRWAHDLIRTRAKLNRVPIRTELVTRLATQAGDAPRPSQQASSMLQRLSTLPSGVSHAAKYQTWVRDAFVFLFGDVLKEPKLESRTFFDTLRRDITFRNAAESGPWFDWKMHYKIDPVLIECKNKDRLKYGDFRQTGSYLGRRMGYLGILACRKTSGGDEERILNWFVGNDEKHVLVVNDRTLIDWIRLKDRGGDVTAAIADLYRSLREGAQ